MSTLPAVVAALVALGEATFSSDEMQVIDGPANSVTTLKQQIVAIGDGPIVTTRGLTDQYTVPILIEVALPGPDSLAQARLLAITAYEAFRDAVRAQEDLNLAGVIRAQVGGDLNANTAGAQGHELQQFARAEGRAAAVRFGVFVMAQSDGPF